MAAKIVVALKNVGAYSRSSTISWTTRTLLTKPRFGILIPLCFTNETSQRLQSRRTSLHRVAGKCENFQVVSSMHLIQTGASPHYMFLLLQTVMLMM